MENIYKNDWRYNQYFKPENFNQIQTELALPTLLYGSKILGAEMQFMRKRL